MNMTFEGHRDSVDEKEQEEKSVVTSAPSPVVLFDQVERYYGKVHALRGVSLRINKGESVALLGPNGAGKTTTIGLMLGLLRPDKGRVLIDGGDPTQPSVRKKARIGAMLQDAGVIDLVRVRELIDIFRSYYDTSLSTKELLEIADLQNEARMYANKLSGGQRQRLLFALALAGDPHLLFLDEPTVGMDVSSRRAFLNRIWGLRSPDRTIILTTHNLADVEELSDRVIVLNKGQVIADDTLEAVTGKAVGQLVSFTSDENLQLADIPGVLNVERNGRRIVLLTRDSDALLEELRNRNIATPHLEVRNASLEEAFLALTREEERS